MDKITATLQRLTYRRVYVEIDVERVISNIIKVKLKNRVIVPVTVEIHWIPPKCLNCKVFGYVKKSYPYSIIKKPSKVWVLIVKE
ncbi:hypothetical protein REPUB_Repub18cG0029400 [Reevesia pubescens]